MVKQFFCLEPRFKFLVTVVATRQIGIKAEIISRILQYGRPVSDFSAIGHVKLVDLSLGMYVHTSHLRPGSTMVVTLMKA